MPSEPHLPTDTPGPERPLPSKPLLLQEKTLCEAIASQDALLLCVAHDHEEDVEAANHDGYRDAPEAAHTHLQGAAHVHAKDAWWGQGGAERHEDTCWHSPFSYNKQKQAHTTGGS